MVESAAASPRRWSSSREGRAAYRDPLCLTHLSVHTPYTEGGTTSTDNLAPLTRTHHRIKTHGHHDSDGRDGSDGKSWQVRHPFPGITLWRDPFGAHYLLDPTGTRRVTPTTGDQTSRVEISLTRILLDYAG